MHPPLWNQCLQKLERTIPAQQLNMWIRPLQANQHEQSLCLLAPNRFVLDWVSEHYLEQINTILHEASRGETQLSIEVGSISANKPDTQNNQKRSFADRLQDSPASYDVTTPTAPAPIPETLHEQRQDSMLPAGSYGLREDFVFDSFVVGKSNEFAHAAATQVGQTPGAGNNPLFIYGGVGLGKTHLMLAVGNQIRANNPQSRVAYVHSERFVGDMVKALQRKSMDEFKRYYRSVNALLIDDIQFFAGKERSQEEFFHTFNTLLENGQQVIMTCDRYPKEVDGVEERLRSRFSWGLTVAIEPPELETRVAILKQKAEDARFPLPDDVAFFIGQKIKSNVRELEGALNRVMANAKFTGRSPTLDFVREALRDILASQDKLISIENIQKIVVEYYQIRVADLLSKRRSRSVTRPRQIAMSLSKELTNHSLPEIGDKFGGRDHTTVIHACRKVAELRGEDSRIAEDYNNLLRTLQS